MVILTKLADKLARIKEIRLRALEIMREIDRKVAEETIKKLKGKYGT